MLHYCFYTSGLSHHAFHAGAHFSEVTNIRRPPNQSTSFSDISSPGTHAAERRQVLCVFRNLFHLSTAELSSPPPLLLHNPPHVVAPALLLRLLELIAAVLEVFSSG
ncbi:hypothetical protein HYC85_023789 [Camellia sinensis]|uniref:Uncharacterized protein n=1 Tax=Camellia sinensis TaxID=4442 RepID=A0A7J7GFJ7_CAMSI|nr:hypothetical protein HYC85_023789 [Camellia sinensis]